MSGRRPKHDGATRRGGGQGGARARPREGRAPEERQAQVFGLHACAAVIARRPESVIELSYVAELEAGNRRLAALLGDARALGLRTRGVDREALDAIAAGVHQGVCLQVVPRPAGDERALMGAIEGHAAPLVLVLDGVQDPHNLGACLRSADAAGAQAVVAPRDRAAGLTATVRKVAVGAAESVPFCRVANLARTLDALAEQGLWRVGADGEAALPHTGASMDRPLVLAMGAEGAGLRRLTRERCDELVAIPMAGTVSSLNVSVATGVLLFEARRQRGDRQSGV